MDRIDNPIYIKFAAIDIGSNAIRLLFYNIYEDGNGQDVFKKVALTRVPIRLGEDVFVNGSISKEKEDKLLKAMLAFRNLIEIHDVKGYRACATSAMREADN
ncbi:MAG: exopolyphosphatase, partial [Flavobacteriales bacterium]|nr:exopolyphosphatase [Flavobacteriales bacterium]